MSNDRVPALATMCQDLESQLQKWYANLSKQHSQTTPQGLFWPELSTLYLQLPPSSPARIFSFFLCFPNLDIAEQILLYWTGLLLMHRTIDLAERRLRQHGLPMSIPIPPTSRDGDTDTTYALDPHSLALNIATSLEYIVHPDMGLLETHFIGFPMNVALGYFNCYGMRERLWSDVVRARMHAMNTGHGDLVDEMAERGVGCTG